MDVVRINLSHGTLDEAIEPLPPAARGRGGRSAARSASSSTCPGPRSAPARSPRAAPAHRGDTTSHDARATGPSTAERIHVDYERPAPATSTPATAWLFGDGGVVVEVDRRRPPTALVARVTARRPAPGSARASTSRPSASGSPTPTPHDLRLLDAFVNEGVDMVAVSFVRSAHDIRRVGTEPHPAGPLVIAKIETRAAVENLDGIIEAAGAVMVARGDLGAEMPIEELPHLQKRIIHRCIALGGRPSPPPRCSSRWCRRPRPPGPRPPTSPTPCSTAPAR